MKDTKEICGGGEDKGLFVWAGAYAYTAFGS
jgi:hypothetical protein